MSTRAAVSSKVREIGADLRDINTKRGQLEVEVLAPPGKVFMEGFTHALVGSQDIGESAADVRGDLLERLSWGVVECTRPECEECVDSRQDERGSP